VGACHLGWIVVALFKAKLPFALHNPLKKLEMTMGFYCKKLAWIWVGAASAWRRRHVRLGSASPKVGRLTARGWSANAIIAQGRGRGGARLGKPSQVAGKPAPRRLHARSTTGSRFRRSPPRLRG